MERKGPSSGLASSGAISRPGVSPLSLVDLLLQVEDQQPSRKLLLLLFDSLVSSNFSANQYHPIRNAAAANVLLSVLPRAALPIQIEALTNLNRLCELSLRNCHVLCENGALQLALDILPNVQNEPLFEKLLAFATTLGSYNMNPPEVKSFILAMRKMLESARPSRISSLSKAFQKMLKRTGHVSSFSFDSSKDCGLLLPPFPMPSGGYTLCFWLRVEHMPSSANHFRIVSLLNEEGDGLTVWISEKHGQILLNVANYSGGTVTTQLFEQAPLVQGRWFHITLSHIPKVFVFGRSEIKLYVNGNHKQSKNLGYLSYNKPMSKSWIGSDSEITFSSIPSELCISGQMNCVSMYNEALSDERIASISLLPPDNPRQLAYLQGANLVWLYHPQATEREIAFDVGPWSLHSAKIGELVSACCLTAQDALFSAGGISLLFPFIHHLVDLAATPGGPEAAHGFSETQKLCTSLFELIGDILLLSETHRQDTIRSNAIGLLGFVMEEIASEHFDFQFLVTVDRLVTEMLSVDVHLAQDLYLKIFFNFRIWSSTHFDLQKQWMLAVVRHVGNNPVYFRDKFGVQDILDCMQNYYPYPEANSTLNAAGLSAKQVSEMRSMLGYVLRTVTHGDINEMELKSILSFVLESPRAAEVVDVLNALVWFSATAPKNTYDALRKIGDITIFFGLLHHNDERVRISIIKIISFILSTSYNDVKRQKIIQEQIAPWLHSAFSAIHLTEECYTTLAELLLGKPQFPENSDRFDAETSMSFRQFDIEGNLRIANPDIGAIIFKMSKNASAELQVKIFQDFLALLSHGKLNEISAFNCAALSQKEDWAVTLLDVMELIEKRKRNAAASVQDKEVLNDVHIMAASLINGMLLIPMITRKDGWKGLVRFLAICDSYRSKMRVTKMIRTVLSNLMASLKSELAKLEAAAASVAAAEALNATSSPGASILASPAGQLVSAAVSSIGSLSSTVGATLSAAGAAVGGNSNQLPAIPHTVTKAILCEATAHVFFVVEEFLYMMPDKRSYTQLDVPSSAESALDAGDAHRLLRGDMHRNHRSAQSSEDQGDEVGQRKWKDFALATQMMELFDAFAATSSDQLIRIDTTSFFGKERTHIMFAVLRVLVSLLLEAPVVNDVKAIREKMTALKSMQTELTSSGVSSAANLKSSVEIRDDFSRRQFLSYVNERLEELMKQGKLVEHFYHRCAERCRIVLLFIKQHNLVLHGAKPNDLVQNVTIHVMNQFLSLFKSMIGANDPLFLAIGGHLRSIILDNMQGVFDSFLGASVANPFTSNVALFDKGAPMRDLVAFVQEILPAHPETMERLALATRSFELCQIVSMKSVLDARIRATADVRSCFNKLSQDQDERLQRSIRTHTSLAQKVSLKEVQRRVSRGYAERKLQDVLSSLFAYTWKLMNDCSSVWRDYLIPTQQQAPAVVPEDDLAASNWTQKKPSVFTKIDKSEQVMRIRAKIKKNYRGKQHTEASFSYLKSKWKKDADELRQRQMEANKKLQELQAAQEATATVSPRAASGSSDANQEEALSPREVESPKKESADTNTSARSGSIGSAATGTPVRTNSTRGGRASGSLSKAKSKIVSIETEVDEMFETIDTDDFTLLDSDATLELDKNMGPNDLVFSSKCEIIYPEVTVSGRLDVTKTTIYFFFERERIMAPLQRSPSSDELETLAAGIGSFGSPPSSPPRSRAPSAAGDPGTGDYRKWTRKMFGQKIRDREWQVDDVVGIYSRRYLLNWTALELFFDNNRNYLLNLPKEQNRALYKALISLRPKRLTDHYFATGAEMFKKRQDITDKWRRREISNFEYLMHLNELASRTYNDLTQYPVFPWVLSNYSSDKIDLSDPKNYRDLRLPVGALDAERFSKFQDRFENFIDDQIPPFHYGSHYSSAGTTLFFLIRMEPFTSQFICLQGGKFDYPDRLFSSIPEAWENVLKSTTDVKELIPEFFCMPDYLTNRNGFDFGIKSNGKRIGDVELPQWAKTPEEFIRIQREALESEIVSQNLHHWIDLIFGYKQRGEHAVAARNTFYYLTYEGAVDLDSLWNPVQRKAVMDQIENFGQTPAQLLTTPHPQRDAPRGNLHVWYPLSSEVPPFVFAHTQFSYQQLPYNSPFFLFAGRDRIVTCNTYGEYLTHKWEIAKHLLAHESDSPMRLDIDEQYSTSSSLSSLPASVTTHVQKMRLTDAISKRALAGSNRRLDLLNVTHHTISCKPRFLTVRDDPMVVLSYNHWDNTIQVSRFEEANSTKSENGVTRAQQAIAAHKRPVTCAAIDQSFLVTGSADGSAAIWRCDYKRRDKKEGFGIITPALYSIHGHTSCLTAVAINRDWDIVVTGSEDGVLAVHHLDLRRQDTRALINLGACISSIVISPVDGSFVVYTSTANNGARRASTSSQGPSSSSSIPISQSSNSLFRYSINAELLAELRLGDKDDQSEVASLVVTADGKYLITAGGKLVTVRRLFDLTAVYKYQELPGEAFSAALDPEERALFVSTKDGKLVSYCKRDGSILLP